MAKIEKFTGNERVDLDALQAIASAGNNALKIYIEKIGIDNWARVIEGFRCSVDTSSADITVYNGVSFDRDGQLVSNEDDYTNAISKTLVGNGTHYVEVKFVWNDATIKDRAFWDATYDNGTDTSGDA